MKRDVFFFKQKTAYEIGVRLVGSEMCIRDRIFFVLEGGVLSKFLLDNSSFSAPPPDNYCTVPKVELLHKSI